MCWMESNTVLIIYCFSPERNKAKRNSPIRNPTRSWAFPWTVPLKRILVQASAAVLQGTYCPCTIGCHVFQPSEIQNTTKVSYCYKKQQNRFQPTFFTLQSESGRNGSTGCAFFSVFLLFFDLLKLLFRFMFFDEVLMSKEARIAESNTSFKFFCVNAEHSI